MTYEPFAVGDSIVHRIDPRLKLVAATAFSILVAVAQQYAVLIPAVAIGIALVLAARLDLLDLLKRLWVVLGFLILIWVVVPVTCEGPAAFHIGPLDITQPGIALSARISLKSIAIVLAMTALVATIPMATVGHALQGLKVPSKIVHLLLMTYRYLFVIEKEYHRLVRAAGIRGFTPRTDLHTYKTYAYFVGVLFLRAVERAERVSAAMKCRGFDGRFFSLTEFPAHPRNAAFAAMTAVSLSVLAALEWIRLPNF